MALLIFADQLEGGHSGGNVSEDGVKRLLEGLKEALGVISIRPRGPVVQYEFQVFLSRCNDKRHKKRRQTGVEAENIFRQRTWDAY